MEDFICKREAEAEKVDLENRRSFDTVGSLASAHSKKQRRWFPGVHCDLPWTSPRPSASTDSSERRQITESMLLLDSSGLDTGTSTDNEVHSQSQGQWGHSSGRESLCAEEWPHGAISVPLSRPTVRRQVRTPTSDATLALFLEGRSPPFTSPRASVCEGHGSSVRAPLILGSRRSALRAHWPLAWSRSSSVGPGSESFHRALLSWQRAF